MSWERQQAQEGISPAGISSQAEKPGETAARPQWETGPFLAAPRLAQGCSGQAAPLGTQKHVTREGPGEPAPLLTPWMRHHVIQITVVELAPDLGPLTSRPILCTRGLAPAANEFPALAANTG